LPSQRRSWLCFPPHQTPNSILHAAAEGSQATIQHPGVEGALIYPSAANAGLPVPTANRDEFDVIQQIAPKSQFIHF
jgi:hypothetical protein